MAHVATNERPERRNVWFSSGKLIAYVPWGRWGAVLVHRAKHQGREFVRIRRWAKHRDYGTWYPTRKYFCLPVEHADGLAKSVSAAARGEPLTGEPEWFAEFWKSYEAYRARQGESPPRVDEEATPARGDDGQPDD